MPTHEAKFPKGEKMSVEDVAAVVGDSFKEMNENPPESVVKVRGEMEGKVAARQRLTWQNRTSALRKPWVKGLMMDTAIGEDRRFRYVPFHELPPADQSKAVRMYPHKSVGAAYDFEDEHYFYPVNTRGDLARARRSLGIPLQVIKSPKDMQALGYEALNPGWEGRMASDFSAREAASGLYGFNKATQNACESASKKLAKTALRIAKDAFAKDADVVSFLQAHVKREGSRSAKVLLAAMKEIGPKVASEMRGGRPKEAGAAVYGLYGFKSRTADLGLDACKEVRAASGRLAADLHHRKGDSHEKITGFLKQHSREGKCAYAGMLLSCYPDAEMRLASTRAASPTSVGGWLEWED